MILPLNEWDPRILDSFLLTNDCFDLKEWLIASIDLKDISLLLKYAYQLAKAGLRRTKVSFHKQIL